MQQDRRGALPLLAAVVVGVVIGAAASWSILVGTIDGAAPMVDAFIRLLGPIAGAIGLGLAVAVPLSWWAINRFLRGAKGTLDHVVGQVSAATQAVSVRDSSAAIAHAEKAILGALAWYGPIAARRWVVQTALALLIAFGGLIGTALLFRQTRLLGEQNEKLEKQTSLLVDQNKKIDLQTITAETQRRTVLSAELFSILQGLMLLEATSETPANRDRIMRSLSSRISAVSLAATPYWTIEVERGEIEGEATSITLSERARSPERGQLLMGLLLAGLDPISFPGTIYAEADLRRIPLQRAKLQNLDFLKADLSEAKLLEVDLREANLQEAKLDNAQLSSVLFENANLERATAKGATIVSSNLERAILIQSELSGARIKNTNLSSVQAEGIELSQSIIIDSKFEHGSLEAASFNRSIMVSTLFLKAKLANAGFRELNSIFESLGAGDRLNHGKFAEMPWRDQIDFSAESMNLDFTESDLRFADFTNAYVKGANFRRANLSRAVLKKATLRQANLLEASLEDADLEEADLTGAKVDQAALSKALLCRTTMPDGTISGCSKSSPKAD
ncbi:MAG: pentapeptide repeat-containing protein [Bosea sp.]|uniref:pentapeptide repeat-containing protein n=1 Tax=Bosea sp. (in: a-proteobacteria) TaxID=1871050 RepID=UPI00238C7895|nr:pentapeptide repeat-containing protein [Bosea sp. (in: a-proteobacteria)]MCP4735879.1 pentapeptide repeat-containing protein [Bosea sp. (in: a-proteobacteria)]